MRTNRAPDLIPSDCTFDTECPWCRGGGVGLRGAVRGVTPAGEPRLLVSARYPCWCVTYLLGSRGPRGNVQIDKPFSLVLDD